MVRGQGSPQCHLLNHMEGWRSPDLFLVGWSLGIVGASVYCQRTSYTADISIQIARAFSVSGNCLAGCLLTVNGAQYYVDKFSTVAPSVEIKFQKHLNFLRFRSSCWLLAYCRRINIAYIWIWQSLDLSPLTLLSSGSFSFLFCLAFCNAEQNWWVVSHVVLLAVRKKSKHFWILRNCSLLIWLIQVSWVSFYQSLGSTHFEKT